MAGFMFPQAPLHGLDSSRALPVVPVSSTADDPDWQGWDDEAFWQSLFNPLPTEGVTYDVNTERAQELESRKRRKFPPLKRTSCLLRSLF
jgi:hypothetical protein